MKRHDDLNSIHRTKHLHRWTGAEIQAQVNKTAAMSLLRPTPSTSLFFIEFPHHCRIRLWSIKNVYRKYFAFPFDVLNSYCQRYNILHFINHWVMLHSPTSPSSTCSNALRLDKTVFHLISSSFFCFLSILHDHTGGYILLQLFSRRSSCGP